jgi:NitT/TauT family transport system substrate-binding protein
MFKKIVLFTLGLAIGLMGCAPRGVQNEAGLRHIILPMGYIPNVQFAPMYVAIEKGFFAEEGIEIEFDYSFETDGVALVGAGELQFVVASGEQVLLARSQGLPVVYTFAWYQDFPVSVVAKTSEGINAPADLRGKRIGLPGLYGANYIGLQALLFSAGLTASDVTMDSIGFNQVEALATDQEQAVVGYAANEPIQLRAQGYDVTELRVADYVQLTANGLVASEEVIAQEPELVRAMARAMKRGIEYTIANPDEAYEICKKFVENLAQSDETVQKQVLATSMEFWKAERTGYSDRAAWENMNNLLVQMGLLKESQNVDDAFTNEFVP